ncbi:MAG: hypothetical protein E6R04_11970 [Spirochaetes bacterium]|nr:MAG: hypothetical protein E6R04_11970 [Spirochaetota bacterium]
MDLFLNGTFILGITYLIAGIAAISRVVSLWKLTGNGLKSILIHLFFAWSGHYITIGSLTFGSFILGHEILPLNTLRLIASLFVVIQFIALLRLYFYIVKK